MRIAPQLNSICAGFQRIQFRTDMLIITTPTSSSSLESTAAEMARGDGKDERHRRGSETSRRETTPTPSDGAALLVVGTNYDDFRQDLLKRCVVNGTENNDRGALDLSTPSDESTDAVTEDRHFFDSGSDFDNFDDENMERSGGDRPEQRQRCDKLARASDAFKDPFPSLSPIPLKSLPSGHNRLNLQNVARHNMMQDRSPSSLVRDGSDSGVLSPITTFTPQTPPRSRANTNSSITRNDAQKMWMDPFPTPDVSVHSRCGTPCSFREKCDSQDLSAFGKNLNADWETAVGFLSMPIEESSPSQEERSLRSSLRSHGAGGRCSSSPQLDSMGGSDLSVRKSSSPMMRRPSLDDVWCALKSGPDGNELVLDYGRRDVGREKKERRGKKDRRDSERAMIWREPFEYHGSEPGKPLRRRGRDKTLERSFTAPVETSWSHLTSPLNPFPDDNGNRSGTVQSNGGKSNNHFENHSATITNVTGANLAMEVKKLIVQREGGAAKAPTTPERLRSRAWRKIKTSKAVAKTGEIVFSPVRSVRNTGRHAARLVRTTRQKLKERKELRRQRRLARMKEPPPSWWIVIPADHPYKIAWDVLTMIWAVLGAHRTHVRIRDRVFDQSPLIILTEVWFTVDILLNFVTEHKTRQGNVIKDGKAVWARYLTTWFVVDVLSLIPWERVYVRPVVERIKRRNIFQKTFFRSKAVVRVSRVLRGRHVKLIGRVSRETGTPLRRMVTMAIKYIPRYLVFLRNMKGALVVRALRFVHWLHNMYKKIWVKARAARHRISGSMRHPIFTLVGPRENEVGSDSSDDEEDDDDDEIDVGSESSGDDDYDLVLMDDSDRGGTPLANFHRTVSEGSPSRMRRSFSQNELWLR